MSWLQTPLVYCRCAKPGTAGGRTTLQSGRIIRVSWEPFRCLRGCTGASATLLSYLLSYLSGNGERANIMTVIQGQLVRGLGKAADFTQIDWVRRQLIEYAGIDPHPD